MTKSKKSRRSLWITMVIVIITIGFAVYFLGTYNPVDLLRGLHGD